MTDPGRILLVDDEETFLLSTSGLLEREGFVCSTAPDGAAASALLARDRFDVLIADIRMPGNADLELVRGIARSAGGLPVILVTGYPSLGSAIASVELPVVAYLVKPFDFAELLHHTRAAVEQSRIHQTVVEAERRAATWRADLAEAARLSHRTLAGGGSSTELEGFLSLSLKNIAGSLTDLQRLALAHEHAGNPGEPCQVLNCPRYGQLAEALREAVRVLEETKNAFRSKRLGALREQLEATMLTVGAPKAGLP
jgi:CheY-like chemotaxis protein